MSGPKLQDDLFEILLRWRKYPIVFTADVEKMYRQIWVHEEDAEYQRILWRNSPNSPIIDYKLLTVTFGTTSAPYLAIKTLQKLASDEKQIYPEAAKVAMTDFYVDDVLTGVFTVKEGVILQDQLSRLLKAGGFNLRKWAANRKELLENIPKEDKELTGILNFDTAESVKTLGIHWFPKLDSFKYKISKEFEDEHKITKRKFLSNISKIFDPLGLLSPFIIKLKIMMQTLWIQGTDWDQEMPVQVQNLWKTIASEMKILEQIQIPRWIDTTNNVAEIHGFCDGSIHAYAAVLYVKTRDQKGCTKIKLLTSKTKVTPVKQISIPRIELCGAALLCKLYQAVKDAMKFEKIKFYAWTDSTIVLAWLRSHPGNLKTFVANRIAEIQNTNEIEMWSHVPTNSNPADLASRGLHPKELLKADLWWNGPDWLLHDKQYWPKLPQLDETLLETKQIKVHLTTNAQIGIIDQLFNQYSSLQKLLRVTAYIMRVRNIIKKNNVPSNHLTIPELKEAEKILIIHLQQNRFTHEIKNLRAGVPAGERLNNLHPFIDADNILRVGGRLHHASIPWEEKHPIIITDKHPLTSLIINNMHKTTLHGGTQLMISMIRRKYWLLNARNEIKRHIHKCVICFRQKAQQSQQLMGSLPAARTQMSRPFEHTGVDYCGPIEIKSSKLRNSKILKAYVAVFICLATKAIHLEVVSELSSQAFIAALKRFIGRRGLCRELYSDNATNFIGAKNVIQKEFIQHIRETMKMMPEIASKNNINWHFIPPASPHFGGLWEAGVKSAKYHLKRVMGNSKLTFEELTTTTIQIEACLNSRPICPMSEDPEDMSVLTPGHFLVGTALLSVPEPTYLDQNIHRLNRWQYIQSLVQGFWRKWYTNYLHTLQQRPKWLTTNKNIEIGNLVLVMEDNLPPGKWMLARVIEVHPGADNLIRVVTLKTQHSTYKRSVAKVCLLPIQDNYHNNQPNIVST